MKTGLYDRLTATQRRLEVPRVRPIRPCQTQQATLHDLRGAPTPAYVERRLAEGRSKPEIMRVLKRYVAREVYHHLPRM